VAYNEARKVGQDENVDEACHKDKAACKFVHNCDSMIE